ncbi:hypothetical protein M1146_08160 [Patescibacteria group bacterium]|nr:hypothetical protein [Patescibacteria group bacterium]
MICSFSSVCIKGTCVGWYYFIVAGALVIGLIGVIFKYFYKRKLAEANRPLIQPVQNSALPQQTNKGYPIQQRPNQGYPVQQQQQVNQSYQTQIQ